LGPAPITLDAVLLALSTLDRHEIVSLALTLGILVFAVTTAIALVRTRARLSARLAAARHEIARLRDEADRATTLLLSEPQVVVMWRGFRHRGGFSLSGHGSGLRRRARSSRPSKRFASAARPSPSA
jgi:hypothetical protein